MSENIAEMMKNTIAAVMGTGEKEYIVKGAKLKCTLGSTPSLLNLPICHGAYATGQPLIHANDNTPIKNILPFGTCPVLGGPCVPSIVGPWLNTHEKLMIADAAPGGPSFPAVTMKSFLVCSNGGIIEPQKSGQEYKTPGTAKTMTLAATTDGSASKKEDEKNVPGNSTINDWMFFGVNGDEMNKTPSADIETANAAFGGDRSEIEGLMQSKIEGMWLVDRIARVLYEELAYSKLSMDCIAWCMFNRMYVYSAGGNWLKPGDPPTPLYVIVTANGAYEVFAGDNGQVAAYPKKEHNSFAYWEEGWNHALYDAKALVSVAGNPTLKSQQEKRNALESYIPCPFKKSVYYGHPEVYESKEPLDVKRIVHHVGISGWGPAHEDLPGWLKVGNDGSCPVSSLLKDKMFQGFYAKSTDPYGYSNLE